MTSTSCSMRRVQSEPDMSNGALFDVLRAPQGHTSALNALSGVAQTFEASASLAGREIIPESKIAFVWGTPIDVILESLEEKGGVTHLDLTNWGGVTVPEDFFEKITALSPNLRSFAITLSFLELKNPNQNIKAIVQNCGELRELKLFGCDHYLNSESFLTIASEARNLEKLTIQNSSSLSNEDVLAISSLCAKITELDLSQNKKLTQESLVTLLHNKNSLQVLDLSGCTEIKSCDRTSLADCHCVPNTRIQTLKLATYQLSSRDFQTIFSLLPSLKCFSLESVYWTHFDDNSLIALSKNCPNIIDLTLLGQFQNLRVSSFQEFAINHPNLQSLKVSCSNKLPPSAIAEALTEHCDTLKTLKIEGSKRGLGLHDEDLVPLLLKHQKVENLSITNSPFLSTESAKAIAQCEKLKSLHLSSCGLESDDIALIAENCSHLEDLSLFNISVDDDLLQAILKNRPNLKALSLGLQATVTPKGFEGFDTLAPNLEMLDLGYVHGITNESLDIIAKLPSLKTVKLFHHTIEESYLRRLIQEGLKRGFCVFR